MELDDVSERKLEVRDTVFVAHVEVFGPAKWPAFKSKFYGPCMVTKAKYPRYMLRSSLGGRSHKAIHALKIIQEQ